MVSLHLICVGIPSWYASGSQGTTLILILETC